MSSATRPIRHLLLGPLYRFVLKPLILRPLWLIFYGFTVVFGEETDYSGNKWWGP